MIVIIQPKYSVSVVVRDLDGMQNCIHFLSLNSGNNQKRSLKGPSARVGPKPIWGKLSLAFPKKKKFKVK